MASTVLQDLASGEVAQAFMDHMGGPAYFKEYVEQDTSWLSILPMLTDYLEKNVSYYANAGTMTTENSQKRKLISSEGFPASCQVVYSFMSPSGYSPWSSVEDREVKQVVLHSFGHQWHAFKSSGKWFGVMNKPNLVEQYMSGTDTLWLPKGTNVARGMEHTGRLAGALNACMFPTPGNAGTHFIISRAGDLYIFADCNDSMNSSHDLSKTAVSIALEEALYLEGVTKPEATWLPTGSPLGTDGTLKTWDLSSQQYLTLAILLRKLQVGYPDLATRARTTSPSSADESFIGFTQHSHIKGADARYIDVSPHLQTDADWDALFDLVDKQEQVTSNTVFVTPNSGYAGRVGWVEGVLESLDRGGFANRMVTSPALVSLLGILRVHREFQNTNRSYRAKAAVSESKNSISVRKQVGMEVAQDQASKAPASTLGEYTPGTTECEWDL
jgi:hypothetical protein